jgi:phospholipid/cholesterol/gamma-HCH transport system permease protein
MDIFYDFGRYCQLLYQAIRSSTEFKTYYKNFISEMIKTGYDSLPIVMLAGAFTGAVLTIQTSYQLVSPVIPKSTIGAIVVQSIVIELAAVISGLVLAGRVGARIATELGTMRVSEQIDAIESMGFNSISFLVVPRVLASFVMFPVLYVAAASCGVGGGVIAGVLSGQLPAAEFLKGGREFFLPWDIVFGLTKAVVFGFVITSISCFKGYYATGGAEGVGKATTNAAVLSCIFILLSDLVLAALLL